jgi:ribosomal protein L7/L12
MTSRITIRKERTITEVTSVSFPEWMEQAIAGNKIHAIKSLRDDSARYDHGLNTITKISLGHAKTIVEMFMSNIVKHVE